MRILWIVLAIGCLVGCGSPAPGTDETAEVGEEGLEHGEEEGAPELPPEGALPLSDIVAALEAQGHIPILEIEFEDGVWDIDCLMKGEEWEVEVDPLSGEILSSQAE